MSQKRIRKHFRAAPINVPVVCCECGDDIGEDDEHVGLMDCVTLKTERFCCMRCFKLQAKTPSAMNEINTRIEWARNELRETQKETSEEDKS